MPLIQILSRTTVSRGDEIKPDNTQTPQSKRRRPSYSNRLLGRNTRAPSIQDEFGTSGPQDGHHVFITDPVVAEGRDATER
ncbi:hypothetical protein EW026_g2128 [Hermanssonia centrifuga]|uniref:Uncharacterized protein n=1 Tax=Hermanssonia centrifuga TaxID=98765 RepID=A0A4S4KQ66_9APHY|nr:hypothetical protein EW026_g2128 [Hermanssonia centrifuga]